MDSVMADWKTAATALRDGFLAYWSPEYWMSIKGRILPTPFTLLLLPPIPWINTCIVSFSTLLYAASLFFLAREFKQSPAAAGFVAVSGALSSHFFTLLFPGHLAKMMTYAFVPLSCLGFFRWLDRRDMRSLLLCALALGMALLCGEGPIAYFTGIWFCVWGTFHVFQSQTSHERLRQALRTGAALVAIVLLVALFAWPGIRQSSDQISDNKPVVTAKPEQTWNFATQFFFPPEELISYLTTVQFFGAPEAYWGRDGEPQALRFSDDYMGLLPLGFALLAAVACWRQWHVRMLACTGLLSLIISFGKNGLVYALIYELPAMKSIRNPHRWTFFVAFSVCVLAGFGVDFLLLKFRDSKTSQAWFGKWGKRLFFATVAGLGLFIAGLLFVQDVPGVTKMYYGPVEFDSARAPLYLARTQMLLFSLLRTGVMVALSCGVLAAAFKQRARSELSSRRLILLLGAGLAVTMVDLGWNNARYIHFFPWRAQYEQNPVSNYLRQDPDCFFVKAFGAQQSSAINDLVLNILPFYRVQVTEPPATSRLPEEMSQLFKFFETHPIEHSRYLDFFNVKYLLAPGLIQDPQLQVKHVFEWEGVHVYQRNSMLPRAWLVPSATLVAHRDEALERVFSPAFSFLDQVVLEENTTLIPPPPPATSPSPLFPNLGKACITSYQDNQIVIETTASTSSFLVVNERWHPSWKAWLDGKPAKIYRANYAMRSIELPAGSHIVKMEYRASLASFWISFSTMLAALLIILWPSRFALRTESSR